MDVDTDNDGDCLDFDDTSVNPAGGAERYFYCQDANWNVIALRHGSEIVERYEYDPYGNVRIFKGYDSAAGHEDLTVVLDSTVRDVTDPPLAYGNPILFAGYFYDNETGLYHVRHRMYSPTLQRWLQHDPDGYVDGASLYVYAQGNPGIATDSHGRCVIYFKCTKISDKVTGCNRDCLWECKETRREEGGQHGSGHATALCDDPMLPPRGKAIVYESETTTDWSCWLTQWLSKKCQWLLGRLMTPDPPPCSRGESYETYKVWRKVFWDRDCSKAGCKKACREGGPKCEHYCQGLPPALRWVCESMCRIGGKVCENWCDVVCEKP